MTKLLGAFHKYVKAPANTVTQFTSLTFHPEMENMSFVAILLHLFSMIKVA
jgi:hypothetical protein